MSAPAAAPNKRALLIGVNKYPNLPAYSQLKGCVNDVEAMRSLLETTFKFPPANVQRLVDEEATEKNIRAALERLLESCGEGDIVVFHYSGHGSQMAAKGDKPRGYDESIMPHDSGRMNPNFPRQVKPCDIRDTEIREWLSRLTRKTRHVTLIFDSCHSGSITRFGDDAEDGTRLRWVPPDPLPDGGGPPEASAERGGHARDGVGSGWLPPSDSYVLLAACAAEQGAFEMELTAGDGTTRQGAFTFYLVSEIEQSLDGAGGAFTYRDLWERVAARVTARFQRQTPLLEGARDRFIFDVRDAAPARYLLVTGREGDEVRLDGGAVHGLTVGSLCDIYPAGVRLSGAAQARRQGRVEVVSVGPLDARARVTEEEPPSCIAAGARAVEVMRAEPEAQMHVRLAPAPAGFEQAVAELREELGRSGLLQITDSLRGARAEVRVLAPDDAAPRRGAASWEVTDGSAPLMPRYPVDAPESGRRIRDNLETVWRFQKILELRNEQSALKGKVDFVLLKKGAGGAWGDVPGGESPVYEAGDQIAFRVVNRSETLIHASVLDLGLSKRVDVLYPPSAASEAIAVMRSGESAGTQGGGVLTVGLEAGDEIKLFFPEGSALVPEANGGEVQEGSEYFKLVVTTRRHDLSFLTQPGLRKDPPAHPLERLLYLAARGEPSREAQLTHTPQDEWFTCERHFRLRRRA